MVVEYRPWQVQNRSFCCVEFTMVGQKQPVASSELQFAAWSCGLRHGGGQGTHALCQSTKLLPFLRLSAELQRLLVLGLLHTCIQCSHLHPQLRQSAVLLLDLNNNNDKNNGYFGKTATLR